jgi:chromosome segregation ATPase
MTSQDSLRSNPQHEDQTMETGSIRNWTTPLLVTALAIVLAGGLYQHTQLTNVRLELAGIQREMGNLRQSLSTADANVAKNIGSLKADLETTKQETVASTQEAKNAARQQAQIVASQMTKRQDQERQVLAKQLNDIKATTEDAAAKLTDITSQVGNVKTEVGDVKTQMVSARTDLDRTIAELKRTTGDLGVMSGLIATNSKEIGALKELGDRNITEFSLTKSQKSQRVGDIVVTLKKADTKRNRYTVDLVVDDKKIEKKEKTINEPVQFYVVSKARQPYEMVVNEVQKDRIVGYLAAPKSHLAAKL